LRLAVTGHVVDLCDVEVSCSHQFADVSIMGQQVVFFVQRRFAISKQSSEIVDFRVQRFGTGILLSRLLGKGIEFLLPTDHQVVDSYEPIKGQKIVAKTIPIEFTNIGLVGMDIGIETVALFSSALQDARMIVWNGPMGVFEEPPFDQGTIGIAKAVAEASDRGAITIVGGGDSVSAVTRAGVADRITHISTGGGATLEYLAGEKLPGVEALTDKT